MGNSAPFASKGRQPCTTDPSNKGAQPCCAWQADPQPHGLLHPASVHSGVQLPLPAGYSGVVLERSKAGDDAEGAAWAAAATFASMHYWNHDAAPLKGDGLRRCLEWAELAAGVHTPVDPAAVAAAAVARQQSGAG